MKKYYPTYWSGCNPIHEVKEWSKVRSIIRACKAGNASTIPPIYIDGPLHGGNLLTGTHRAAANDIIMMLNEKNNSEIGLVSYLNVQDYLSDEQIAEIAEINDDVQTEVDSIIARTN